MSSLRLLFRNLTLCSVIVLAGCQRGDPLDGRIGAGTPAAFQQWRGRGLGRLTLEQRQDVDTAIQELKFKLMAEGTSGSAAIDEALCEQLAGKTVRDLINLGLTAKIERLEQQRAAITTIVAQNASLVTREGDVASASYLARKREDQLGKRAAVEQDIAAIRARMQAAGLTPPELKPVTADPKPAGAVEESPDTMPQLEHR